MAFTDLDEYYQLALARYNAKENLMREKYEMLLKCYEKNLIELEGYKPSPARDSLEFRYKNVIHLLKEFLKDIETPCDLILTEFEMRSRK